MNCPGSVALCDTVKHKDESEYAKEGSAAHALAEFILQNHNPKILPKTMCGFEVTDDMETAVRVYVDFLAADYIDGDEVDFEVKFDLSMLYPGMYGTADCVRYRPSDRSLRVTDYKHGAGVAVEVFENPQLLYYAVGACYAKRNRGVDKIELCVVQPRCPHQDGDIRIWTIDAIELMDFTSDLIAAAKRTGESGAELNAGDWCRWCLAAGICPQLSDIADKTITRDFNENAGYDAAVLAETLERIPFIEAWIKGVHSFAYNEAQAGRCPPGFKLVEKRASRSWSDEKAAMDLFIHKYDLPKDKVLVEPVLRSPAQMEKILGKNKEIVKTLTVAKSSGTTLVSEKDRRPSFVRVSAADEFSDAPDI